MSSAECPKETAPDGPSLFQNGNLVFQAHHVGWIIASFFTIVAMITSFWLVNKHLQWYTKKREQRYIVRILFMPPIYATISLASYFFWNHSTPLLLIRDGYESTVLTSFFYLLLQYLASDPVEQKLIFRKNGMSREQDREARRKGEKPPKWVFPLGFVKWKPADGLLFLQAMKWAVLQYCVLRPVTTLAAVVLEYMGLYCEQSWGLGWGHVYITIIVSLSVTVAMYCLIQLYVTVKEPLAPQKPLMKLFAVKAVVFLTFWQATALSALSMFGIVKDTKYMTAEDINIGIGALLETFEMMLFASLHIKAFSYKPYRPFHHPDSSEPPPQRTPKLKALGHALDFRETFREIWQGWLYLYDKMRGKPPKLDSEVKQWSHYEGAFDRTRPSYMVDHDVHVTPPTHGRSDLVYDVRNPEIQWLGQGDNYGYGIAREKSEGLEARIEKELDRRGYGNIPGRGHIKPAHEADAPAQHQTQRSWWRSVYDRISSTGYEEQPQRKSNHSKQHPRHHHRDSDATRGLLYEYPYEIEDQPPRGLIREHLSNGLASPSRNIPRDSAHRSSHQTQHLAPEPDHRQKRRRESNKPRYDVQPPSPLLLSPTSADSVLGRVFPYAGSSADHSTGLVNYPYTSAPLPSQGSAVALNIAGQRKISSPELSYPNARSMEADIFDSPPSRNSHRRESAGHSRAAIDTAFVSPTSPEPLSPRQQDLRRNSAKIFDNNAYHPPNRRRPQVQMPEPLHRPEARPPRMSTPVNNHGQYPAQRVDPSRRMSTPLQPASRPSHRTRQSGDNMASTIAQPSFSGTFDVSKFPDLYPNGLVSESRYPGLASAESLAPEFPPRLHD
ncbi:organic solute transporter Ostalpha-domain-containing protein [Mycena floridula]|nr:organic solute transporter Ostalpha-domain-containing protein [Mycena floridula]